MRKSVTAAAMAASLAIGGAAGAVLFVPTLSGAQAEDAPTEDAPTEVPADDRHDGFLADALAPLVEDGTIDQSQADAVVEAIREARPERGAMGHHVPFGTALLDVLGVEADELRDALADGQTIAEIAEANGVAVEDVVAVLVAEAQEHLDEAVADGHLTQEEADEKAADLTEHLTAMVQGELAPGMGRGHHGHRGPFGPGADDESTGS